jgi:Amt family ammonium transporter
MVAYMKPRLGYDDSLDAFGVHGIGGILGVVLTGVFASPLIQSQYSGALYGNFEQLKIQLIAAGVAIVFSGVGTYLLFKLSNKFVGVRANDKHEAIGLDETHHGETAYTNFD